MFSFIKKIYPKINSVKVIRAIASLRLKKIDIRKVQYMAGQRYVSSTERFNAMNMQELNDSLNKYHPMKQYFEVANCDLKIKKVINLQHD